MSSILDALSKVDPADPASAPTFALPPPRPPRRRGPLLAVLLIAAGAIVTAITFRGTPEPAAVAPAPPPPVAVVPTPPPSTAPPAPVAVAPHGLPVVAAVPPPSATSGGDRPWIRTDAPPPPPAAVEPPRPAADVTPPPPPVPAVPNRVLVAPKPDLAAAAPARPSVPPPAPLPTTLSGVRVSFLAYSRIPDLRTVSLALDDDRLVTLREGERAGDLEVVHIFPDHVEVKRGGETFTVRARN